MRTQTRTISLFSKSEDRCTLARLLILPPMPLATHSVTCPRTFLLVGTILLDWLVKEDGWMDGWIVFAVDWNSILA